MKNKIKIFKNFLLSKNSDFISYSISKVHSTYSDYQKNENFYPMLTFLKKFFYFFDDNNSYPQKKKKTDIVIISNIVSLKNIKDDIYFGNLDKLLKKERIKVLTILRNHTSIRSKKIKSLLKKDSILLSKRLNYLNEILILFNFLKEIFIFIFSKKYFPVKKYLNYFDLLSIISNLRLIHQLDEILDIYKPKFVLFTYEGHAWERLLVFLCNKKNIKIKSIAFQFSTIKKNQIGLFTKLKENYSPDYIATTGNIPFKIIKKKINFSKIIKLGSSKFVKILAPSAISLFEPTCLISKGEPGITIRSRLFSTTRRQVSIEPDFILTLLAKITFDNPTIIRFRLGNNLASGGHPKSFSLMTRPWDLMSSKLIV